MAPRKNGIPICEHIELGQDLVKIHNALVAAATHLQHNYPNASAAVRLARHAVNAVDKLRCELDNVSARENPAPDAWSPTIYYGSNPNSWQRDVQPILDRHRVADATCSACAKTG